MKKKNLLNNLRDYNNELEKILEKKDFSEKVKNLLLSMLYKIEIAYSDYQKTKINVPDKNDFIDEIFDDINKKCKKIKLISVTEGQEFSKIEDNINKKNKEISVIQNEVKLLKAIYEVSQNEFLINYESEEIAKYYQQFFKIADINNKIEVINDFDGWTWFRGKLSITEIYYNILYQNILILIGNSAFQDILSKSKYVNNNIINDIFMAIKNKYGEEYARNIIEYINYINEKIYYIYNKDEVSINNYNENILSKIKKIDNILKNREALEKEFIKRNEQQENIFSLAKLKNILNEEKNELKSKIVEQTGNLSIYIEDIENKIILLQRVFLKCLEMRIEKIDSKKDIIKEFYIARYYNMMNFNENLLLHEVDKLKSTIDRYQGKLIMKAVYLKAINTITNEVKLNFTIYKELLKKKVIDLENLEAIVKKENSAYIINIYDDESLEYTLKLERSKIQDVKINKKIKLFN